MHPYLTAGTGNAGSAVVCACVRLRGNVVMSVENCTCSLSEVRALLMPHLVAESQWSQDGRRHLPGLQDPQAQVLSRLRAQPPGGVVPSWKSP